MTLPAPPRPDQTTREGLEQLAEAVSAQGLDGLTLEEQVRKLQRELLAVQAEQIEIRKLIGSATQRDEEHESRLARLEAESARLSAELAEALSRVEEAVQGVRGETSKLESVVDDIKSETVVLRGLVERALKGFSLRTLGQFALWALGGAAYAYVQTLLHR